MSVYFNSLPFRQYVIIGSDECGYIGYGWSRPHFRHRCRRRCRRRCTCFDHFHHYPYCLLPLAFPGFDSSSCLPFGDGGLPTGPF